MNEQNEKISVLMDDFQTSEPQQADLEGVLKDVNQQYTMHRYQMIGEVMRNELPDQIQLDFAADVMAKIKQEPPLKVEQQARVHSPTEKASSWLWSSLFKPAAGLAIAASVAFVAITTIQLQKPESNVQSELLASENQSSSSAKVEQLARIPVISNAVKVSGNPTASMTNNGMNWKIKRGEPDMQNKLNTYLINHNEYSSSMHGIIPQVRVVGFDGQK